MRPACPFLGLDDDPRTRFTFAGTAHRCYASGRPGTVDLGHQGAFCLTATYPACPRYRPEAAPQPGVPMLPVVAATSTGTTPRRRRPPVPILAVAVVAIGGVAAGVALAGMLGGGAGMLPEGSPRPSALAPSPAVSPAPSSTPQPTPSPDATPWPSPASSPTTSPTQSPAAQRTPRPAPTPRLHVVVVGETLTGIAARFGVTVQAIQKANRIPNPSLILVGQRLVIPPPP